MAFDSAPVMHCMPSAKCRLMRWHGCSESVPCAVSSEGTCHRRQVHAKKKKKAGKGRAPGGKKAGAKGGAKAGGKRGKR